jgi:hypothetical protein
MNKLYIIKKTACILLTFLFLASCETKKSGAAAAITDDKVKWQEFVKSLEKEMGPNGGYADINYRYSQNKGPVFLVQLSTDINSTQWKEYAVDNNSFSKVRDVKFEGKGGAEPNEFLYAVKDYDLNNVYNLVNTAKQKLATEKNVKNTFTVLMAINSPTIKITDSKTEFNTVIWQYAPETATYYTFRFNYKDSCEMMAEMPKGFKL